MAISIAAPLRNNRADQITSYAGALALLRLYTAAYATQLVECVCSSVFAPPSVDGILTLNPVSDGVATATGNAAIARILKADGTTMVMEGLTVSDAGGAGNLKLDQIGTVINNGQTVSVQSIAMTEGNV